MAFLALAGCVAAPAGSAGRAAVVVQGNGAALTFADGATARRLADAQCGGRVRSSVYDRFDGATGTWVFPGGCA